jgi:hypothetical protein
MKRLQKKRSQKSFRTGLLEERDSTKGLRRKLSQAERLLRTQKRLTAPKFLKELQEQKDLYYFNLRLFKSGSGKRFDRKVLDAPIFKAIRYCRDWSQQTEFLKIISTHPESDFVDSGIDPALAKAFKKLSEDPLQDRIEAYDPQHETLLADEFLNAVKQGDVARLRELLRLCEIHETTTYNRPRERQSDSRRWHYYVASAALLFLEKGVLPDKKEIKKLAYAFRASNELPLLRKPVVEWAAKSEQKIKELYDLPKPNWTRIFRELRLTDLPSAPTRPR